MLPDSSLVIPMIISHDTDNVVKKEHTEDVDLANELSLSAGLVGGTEQVADQTTGKEVVEDTVTLDVGLVDAARDLGAGALGLLLVDARSTVGSNAEGEGQDDTVDCGELHFDRLEGLKRKSF